MARRIKKARVTAIALVKRGANALPVLYKADEGAEFSTLTKWNDEQGEILSVVYAPDRADSDDHYADADTIRDMAHSFAREGMTLDVKHAIRWGGKALPKEDAFVA